MVKNYPLRFMEEETHLYDAIKKSAQNNRRSVNGEIMRAIEFYLKEAPDAQYEVKPIEKEVTKKKPKSPKL